jgi:fucose permease
MGVSIDRLGVRRAVILGTVTTTIGRFLTFSAPSSFAVTLAGVTFLPFGAAFGVPALALGVRRYTHESNRAFAFSFFYVALCLACMLGSVLINRIRANCIDGIDVLGMHWSWMRLTIFWSTVLTGYTIFASLYLRDIQVDSDRPLEDTSYSVRGRGVRTSLKEVIEHPRFWRLFWVTMIFCGIRMTFRHLDATFPKYFIRTQGRDAPFEVVVGIEPFLTMFLAPVFTWLLVKFKFRLDQTLLIGAFISGISVYILAIEETYNSAIAFVIVLSIGESIWSPKLYEFSTMVAPEGREGIFVAISFAPVYLASVPVGALSGWALTTFCGRTTAPEERHGQLMWFIIGCFSFSSFVLLWLLRHRLFPPEDNEEAEDGEVVGDDL